MRRWTSCCPRRAWSHWQKNQKTHRHRCPFWVDLVEKWRALVYLMVQSTTRAIYFSQKGHLCSPVLAVVLHPFLQCFPHFPHQPLRAMVLGFLSDSILRNTQFASFESGTPGPWFYCVLNLRYIYILYIYIIIIIIIIHIIIIIVKTMNNLSSC